MGKVCGTPTALAIAVLALLDERPMHPYEMFQTMVGRGEDRLVKVRPGSLYHTVARLTDQGLVCAGGVDREGNRPERTTYRITGQGRATLRARIAEMLRAPAPEYPEFLLGLAESHSLPADQVVELLRDRIAQLDAEIAELDAAIAAAARLVARRYWLVLPYRRETVRAQRDWLARMVDELARGELEWEESEPEPGERTA
ncbi:PadR family transcriptional regulator [Nocardia higoensis]|uniref:PadR family transcriptional regulator n=1 Tax=Nocardia higoensis TaxID=228599 RepID=A0ABS0D9Y1_9NOCA|nr:PadR family transcriptional regulator [Nocardia higoensis]MBF6355281.1 PadR family transcriptional regulator [Nocardia higoensis]